jgi:phytanoyl-CoA hydroxylase
VPGLPAQDAFYKSGPTGTLKQLHRIVDNVRGFTRFLSERSWPGCATAAAVPKNVECALGNRSSARHTAHKMGFHDQPNEALTMWIALDDVDEENGCIRYVEELY